MIGEESKTPAPKNISQDWPLGEWSAKKTLTEDPNTGTGVQARKAPILRLPSLVSAMTQEDTAKRDREDEKYWAWEKKNSLI